MFLTGLEKEVEEFAGFNCINVQSSIATFLSFFRSFVLSFFVNFPCI